jgi:hypothetical protein
MAKIATAGMAAGMRKVSARAGSTLTDCGSGTSQPAPEKLVEYFK